MARGLPDGPVPSKTSQQKAMLIEQHIIHLCVMSPATHYLFNAIARSPAAVGRSGRAPAAAGATHMTL
eukprot:16428559-Heterocapsa_arctica.AAC.1